MKQASGSSKDLEIRTQTNKIMTYLKMVTETENRSFQDTPKVGYRNRK